MTTNHFDTQVEFWIKSGVRLVGDLCNRPQALELLGDVTGLRVADIGCGTGYVSRMLAQRGAKVFGCDNSAASLEAARQAEAQAPAGIEYRLGEVTDLPYADGSMDRLISISVLPYNPQGVVRAALREARRVLRQDGELVIAIVHPEVVANPPAGLAWITYDRVGQQLEEGDSVFQHYIDRDGGEFTAPVYYYSTSFYEEALSEAGFIILRIQAPTLTEEILAVSPHWGSVHGHPAFWQVKACAD